MRLDEKWEKEQKIRFGLARITKKGKYKEKKTSVKIKPSI